jgi:hypothetical protein
MEGVHSGAKLLGEGAHRTVGGDGPEDDPGADRHYLQMAMHPRFNKRGMLK